jgi:hypothetical protein
MRVVGGNTLVEQHSDSFVLVINYETSCFAFVPIC